MSNFDTHFIKFLTLLLVLGLMSGLSSGCQKRNFSNTNNNLQTKNQTAIIGGKAVTQEQKLALKVIYIALGVQVKTTPFGKTITQTGLCSATAISKRILLTAAHCVEDLKANEVYAVLSPNPWNHPLNEAEWISAEKIQIHDKFTRKENLEVLNDLALIKLSKDLSDERVSRLAQAKDLVSVSSAFSITAVGYGETSAEKTAPNPDFENLSTLLNMVVKSVRDFSLNANVFSINQNDLKGICHGDSGGPGYITLANGEQVVLGVTSYVAIYPDEAKKLDPESKYNTCIGQAYYTNIIPQLGWISQNLALF